MVPLWTQKAPADCRRAVRGGEGQKGDAGEWALFALTSPESNQTSKIEFLWPLTTVTEKKKKRQRKKKKIKENKSPCLTLKLSSHGAE